MCGKRVSPFPLDIYKLEEFADDNFRFDKNCVKFSKQVENTAGKGEVACYEQFLLFRSLFNRLVLQTHTKRVNSTEQQDFRLVPIKSTTHTVNKIPIMSLKN